MMRVCGFILLSCKVEHERLGNAPWTFLNDEPFYNLRYIAQTKHSEQNEIDDTFSESNC